MKRILFPLALLALSWNASVAQTGSDVKHTKRTEVQMTRSMDTPAAFRALKASVKSSPMKVTLAENQKLMGLSTTDDYSTNGLGLTGYPGTIRLGALYDKTILRKFSGGNIVKMRFALSEATTVSNVFVYEITSAGKIGKEVVSQTPTTNAAGWNEVTLTTPYTLPADLGGLLVGYDYKQTSSNYPVATTGTNTGAGLLAYGNYGQGEAWYNMGTDNGNLCVQCIVERASSDHDITLEELTTDKYNKATDKMPVEILASNGGRGTISSYKMNVDVDGKNMAVLSDKLPQLTSAAVDTVDASIDISSLAPGAHLMKVYPAGDINGAAAEYTGDDTLSTHFYVYHATMPRTKQLLEHFTSQYCTYCPYGIIALETLTANRNDIAWVSIHGDMSSTQKDSYTLAGGTTVTGIDGASSYPSIALNRCYYPGNGVAVSIGSETEANAKYIGQLLDRYVDYSALPPTLASVNITGKYDTENKKLNITVSGETADDFLAIYGAHPALTVYLTEDGIVAKQLKGGAWISKFTHNNLLRSIVTAAEGDALTLSGNAYQASYTVALGSSWNAANMHIIATLSRPVDMDNVDRTNIEVINTNMIDVKSLPTGIQAVSDNAGVSVVARYAADGRALSAPQRGINLVKMSDGRMMKVIVK